MTIPKEVAQLIVSMNLALIGVVRNEAKMENKLNPSKSLL